MSALFFGIAAGTSGIEQIGHLPGFGRRTCGCIEHVQTSAPESGAVVSRDEGPEKNCAAITASAAITDKDDTECGPMRFIEDRFLRRSP